MIESLLDEVSHAAGRGIVGKGHVGVGEEQDFASGCVRTALGCVRLSEPPRREFVDVQHREPRVSVAQAFGDLPGAVGGAVVDVDDLVVRVAQGEQGPQGPLHRALLVVGGDDDGEAGEWGVVGGRWRHILKAGDRVAVEQGGDGEGYPCTEGEGREGERGVSDREYRHVSEFGLEVPD